MNQGIWAMKGGEQYVEITILKKVYCKQLCGFTEKKKEENKVAEMPENMKKRLAAYAEAVRGIGK